MSVKTDEAKRDGNVYDTKTKRDERRVMKLNWLNINKEMEKVRFDETFVDDVTLCKGSNGFFMTRKMETRGGQGIYREEKNMKVVSKLLINKS